MNDHHHDLENELRQLRPAGPSARVVAAIAHDLRQRSPGTRRWTHRTRISLWASWMLTAAAAAAAAVAWWPQPAPGSDEATSVISADATMVPVGSTNVLLDARDEGLVVLNDGRTAHRVRLRYVDTVRLQDRATSSSIAVSRPREEVRFVPVSFY